jgi:hypothetical protein
LNQIDEILSLIISTDTDDEKVKTELNEKIKFNNNIEEKTINLHNRMNIDNDSVEKENTVNENENILTKKRKRKRIKNETVQINRKKKKILFKLDEKDEYSEENFQKKIKKKLNLIKKLERNEDLSLNKKISLSGRKIKFNNDKYMDFIW